MWEVLLKVCVSRWLSRARQREVDGSKREELREAIIFERTPKTTARNSKVTNDQQNETGDGRLERTPDGTVNDLNPEEVADMIEGMRADSARLERERARDHEEAMARERRLERHNATLMNTLARRIDQNQAIDRRSRPNKLREPGTRRHL